MNIIPEKTKDGSYTLYVPEMDEHYHSTNGAVQESKHVYINAGLKFLNLSDVNIFEMGFGTGLNAILTLKVAVELGIKINYTAIEKYPLNSKIVNSLMLNSIPEPDIYQYFSTIHECGWGQLNSINDNFLLTKLQVDLNNFIPENKFNLVYFDAFAPDKQPDLWTYDIFKKIYNSMEIGGVFVTYSAKGIVRRTLESVGFSVERIPGPPGKRQIIRAIKLG